MNMGGALGAFIGSVLSVPTLISIISLLFSIMPKAQTALSTYIMSHADFDRLGKSSQMQGLVETVDKMSEDLNKLTDAVRENQKDTIKNTLISLLSQPYDQSARVTNELNKLYKLDAHCWVVPWAEDYLKDPHGFIGKNALREEQIFRDASYHINNSKEKNAESKN